MTVVGAASAEGVVGLGEELKHQLLRGHAHAQQKGVIAVVGVEVVLRPQSLASGELDRFVAMGTCVDILGRQLRMGLVEVGEGPRPRHVPPVLDVNGTILRFGLAHATKVGLAFCGAKFESGPVLLRCLTL